MRKPSPATIIAVVALFLSLGGGAYAAQRVLITSIHQIGPGVRAQLRGARGPMGPQGPAGQQGQSAAAPKPETYIATDNSQLTASEPNDSLIVSCKVGDTLLSGGFGGNGEIVTASEQTTTQTGAQAWLVTAHLNPNFTPTGKIPGSAPPAADVNAEAICAHAG